MADHRTKLALKFEPEGPDQPGAIHSFQLVLERYHQVRRHDRERWQEDTDKFTREVVAEGITRRMVAALVADGADWLAYVEGGSE